MDTTLDLSTAVFFKSSYSDNGGGDCVECATNVPNVVPVRDSKLDNSPVVTFRPAAWAEFLTGLRA